MNTNNDSLVVRYNPHAPGMRNGLSLIVCALGIGLSLYCYFNVVVPNQEIVQLLSQEAPAFTNCALPPKYADVQKEIDDLGIIKANAGRPAPNQLAEAIDPYKLSRGMIAFQHSVAKYIGIAASIGFGIISLVAVIKAQLLTPGNIIISSEGIKFDTSRKFTYWNEISQVNFINNSGLVGAGEIVIRAEGDKGIRIRVAGMCKEGLRKLISQLIQKNLNMDKELLELPEKQEAKGT